jgi:hypothetical protein
METGMPRVRAVLPAWIAAKSPAAPAPTMTTSWAVVGELLGGGVAGACGMEKEWCMRIDGREAIS